MQEEIWKDIEGWEGYYQVSNLSQVRSVTRNVVDKRGGQWVFESRVLKQAIKRGYSTVHLRGGFGKSKHALVHRLVAKAFIPNPENKAHVNHIDADKLNNHPSNLEWCTRKENSEHACRLGLMDFLRGQNNLNTTLDDLQVRVIKSLFEEGLTNVSIAKYFKVAHSTIARIRNEKTWCHIKLAA